MNRPAIETPQGNDLLGTRERDSGRSMSLGPDWITLNAARRRRGVQWKRIDAAITAGTVRCHVFEDRPDRSPYGKRFVFWPDVAVMPRQRLDRRTEPTRPTEETLDRLMAVIAAVGRGESRPAGYGGLKRARGTGKPGVTQ